MSPRLESGFRVEIAKSEDDARGSRRRPPLRSRGVSGNIPGTSTISAAGGSGGALTATGKGTAPVAGSGTKIDNWFGHIGNQLQETTAGDLKVDN